MRNRTLVCTWILSALIGCGRPSATAPPNVVLICLDTVRADHLGCYGYGERDTTPHLDALAAEGTLFLDASATAGWTKPSVPSFLTGTYPIQHGVYEGSAREEAGEISHTVPQAATTLAEVFDGAGFATAAFVRNSQLRKGLGFEQGFAHYQDEAGDAREIRWRAQDWIDTRPDGRPFFLYLHLLDAHWPWPVPNEYAARYAPLERVEPHRDRRSGALRDAINAGEHELSADERDAMIALYDGSLRYADDQLAELFAWLERRGLWRETIVCVVSDHGEEFGEHGKVGHGHGLHEALLRVPWILRIPGRAPTRVSTPVSLVDLFPTLLRSVGVEPPTGHEGLDRLASPESSRPILAEHKEPRAYQQSLRRGPHKLVRRTALLRAPSGAAPRPIAGRRYDVDLDVLADGALRAAKVRASEDDVGDLPELKGRVRALTSDGFELCGVPVRLMPGAELYGEVAPGAGPAALRDGTLVKVVARPVGGTLEAQRVKVYAPDAGEDRELRGDLERFEGSSSDGVLEIAGLRVRVDAATRWADVDDPSADLSREEMLEWIATHADAGAGSAVTRTAFDLSIDPTERHPQSRDGSDPLDRALDELVRELAGRRTWNRGDQRMLDSSERDDLRALGY